MSIIDALLLGLVQGLTEFLPVSSSGHLAILKNLLQIKETGLLFSVLLHVGTLVAVFAAFRRDLKKLLLEGCKLVYDFWENIRVYFKNRHEQEAIRYRKLVSNNYRRLLLLLLVSTIPTALEGVFLSNLVLQAESNLLAPAIGLFITGVFLLIIDFFSCREEDSKRCQLQNGNILSCCKGKSGLAVFKGF